MAEEPGARARICATVPVPAPPDARALGGDEYNLELATDDDPSLGAGVISEEARLGSSDERAATTDLAALVSDWATLGRAVTADPGHPPFAATPYRGFEARAVQQTRHAIASFTARLRRVRHDGNGLVLEAFKLVGKARQLC